MCRAVSKLDSDLTSQRVCCANSLLPFRSELSNRPAPPESGLTQLVPQAQTHEPGAWRFIHSFSLAHFLLLSAPTRKIQPPSSICSLAGTPPQMHRIPQRIKDMPLQEFVERYGMSTAAVMEEAVLAQQQGSLLSCAALRFPYVCARATCVFRTRQAFDTFHDYFSSILVVSDGSRRFGLLGRGDSQTSRGSRQFSSSAVPFVQLLPFSV